MDIRYLVIAAEEKPVGYQKPIHVSQTEFLNLQRSLVVQPTSQFAFVLLSLARVLNTDFTLRSKQSCKIAATGKSLSTFFKKIENQVTRFNLD